MLKESFQVLANVGRGKYKENTQNSMFENELPRGKQRGITGIISIRCKQR